MNKIRLHLGELRSLTDAERERHPDFVYVVTSECKCIFNNDEIVIPVGFLSDGSSGGPDNGWSWLFHDYLYATHCFTDGRQCTRKEADDIMYYILDYERNYIYKRIYWLLVRLFSCVFNNAWKKSGRRGIKMME
jgi:hypothetical protein